MSAVYLRKKKLFSTMWNFLTTTFVIEEKILVPQPWWRFFDFINEPEPEIILYKPHYWNLSFLGLGICCLGFGVKYYYCNHKKGDTSSVYHHDDDFTTSIQVPFHSTVQYNDDDEGSRHQTVDVCMNQNCENNYLFPFPFRPLSDTISIASES